MKAPSIAFVLASALVAVAGCGAGDEPIDMLSPDLSATAPTDLAVSSPDLAGDLAIHDYDLAWSMCAGTRLAGTCAERFFEPFAACFHPQGHCGFSSSNSHVNACWQSGATYHGPSAGLPPPWPQTYEMGATRCLISVDYFGQSIVQFCNANDACTQVGSDGGYTPTSGAVYDQQSGIFTCPSGEQVDVGANLGDCPVLNALLNPLSVCDGVGC